MSERAKLLMPLLAEIPWQIRSSGELWTPEVSKDLRQKLNEIWKSNYSHDGIDLLEGVIFRIDDGELSLIFLTEEAERDFLSSHKDLREVKIGLIKRQIENLNKVKAKTDREIEILNGKIDKLDK